MLKLKTIHRGEDTTTHIFRVRNSKLLVDKTAENLASPQKAILFLLHLFFSSSSLFAFFLNLGSSCWRRSFTASRSLTAVLSLEKWKLVVSPACRTSWSWIFAFPSGLIFWPKKKDEVNQMRTCTLWKLPSNRLLTLQKCTF